MYESIYSKEKQMKYKGDSKLSKNQFTKSLTSFHTKKILSKNVISQNTVKKTAPLVQEKSVKNKRIYFSR